MSVERDPQNQPEKRSRTEEEGPEGAEDSKKDPQRRQDPEQGRGAYGEAPLQNTPVKVKIKRFEERSRGKTTPRGTKRKKEPDPLQSRMTQYFSRKERIEATASKLTQGVTCDPLLGDPGTCEPTISSRGATGPEPEERGGAREQKGQKKATPSALERWLQRPETTRSGTQAVGRGKGGKDTRDRK